MGRCFWGPSSAGFFPTMAAWLSALSVLVVLDFPAGDGWLLAVIHGEEKAD